MARAKAITRELPQIEALFQARYGLDLIGEITAGMSWCRLWRLVDQLRQAEAPAAVAAPASVSPGDSGVAGLFGADGRLRPEMSGLISYRKA